MEKGKAWVSRPGLPLFSFPGAFPKEVILKDNTALPSAIQLNYKQGEN
jgi:hypothetical protein